MDTETANKVREMNLGDEMVLQRVGIAKITKKTRENELSHSGTSQGCPDLKTCVSKAESIVTDSERDLNNFRNDYSKACSKFDINEQHYWIMKRRQKTDNSKLANNPCDDSGKPYFLTDGSTAWGEWKDACIEPVSLIQGNVGSGNRDCTENLGVIGDGPRSRWGGWKNDEELEKFCFGFLRDEGRVKAAIESDLEMEKSFQSTRKGSRILVQHKVITGMARADGYTCDIKVKRARDFPKDFVSFKFEPVITGNGSVFVSKKNKKEVSKIGTLTTTKAPSYSWIKDITEGNVVEENILYKMFEVLGFSQPKTLSSYGPRNFEKEIPYKSDEFKMKGSKGNQISPKLICIVNSPFHRASKLKVLPYAGFEHLIDSAQSTAQESYFSMLKRDQISATIHWKDPETGQSSSKTLETVPVTVFKKCNELVGKAISGALIGIKDYPSTPLSKEDLEKLSDESKSLFAKVLSGA